MSGAAALLLQKHPTASPDQIKGALLATRPGCRPRTTRRRARA